MASFGSYLQKRFRSFRYAFRGIYILFQTQANARIHLLAMGVLGAVGYAVRLTTTEWCLILICMALVLGMEACNTALEFLADKVSPEHHDLIGKSKDVAAAAVLLSVILCGIVWALIHVPKFWALWSGTHP
ncbi:MAG: diacylglycerol kinase family protein [Bacteroidia bacterium]|nr:diacylglycerol kinase family protein [Bacteroidia bacterium]